jgi:hypothetical protein
MDIGHVPLGTDRRSQLPAFWKIISTPTMSSKPVSMMDKGWRSLSVMTSRRFMQASRDGPGVGVVLSAQSWSMRTYADTVLARSCSTPSNRKRAHEGVSRSS